MVNWNDSFPITTTLLLIILLIMISRVKQDGKLVEIENSKNKNKANQFQSQTTHNKMISMKTRSYYKT